MNRSQAQLISLVVIASLVMGCTRKRSGDGDDPPVSGSSLPVANDTYNWIGNTPLNTTISDGVLSNDSSGAEVISYQPTTSQGGKVVMAWDGSFTYTPKTGYTGQDSFTYTAGKDGKTGQATVQIKMPNKIVYVYNLAASGNGSYDSPYPNLTLAQTNSAAGDTIYVYGGDGTHLGQSQGIILKANQKLIGEGVDLVFNSRVIRAAGGYPKINNLSVVNGAAVTLHDGNEVAGLLIEATTYDGILGVSRNGGIIRNNKIVLSSRNGIQLKDVQGTVTIRDNLIDSSGFANILVDNDNKNLNLVVESNLIRSAADEGLSLLNKGNSKFLLTMKMNTVRDNFKQGLEAISNDSADVDYQILDQNYFTDNGAENVLLLAFDLGLLKSRIEKNDIKNSGLDGIRIAAYGFVEVDLLDVHDNSIFASGTDGLDFKIFDSAKVKYDATHPGVQVRLNDIFASGDRGIEFGVAQSSTFGAQVLNNQVSNSAQEGLRFDSQNTNISKLIARGNTFTGNNISLIGKGAGLFVHDSSQLCLAFDGGNSSTTNYAIQNNSIAASALKIENHPANLATNTGTFTIGGVVTSVGAGTCAP